MSFLGVSFLYAFFSIGDFFMNTIMSRDKLLARGYCCGLGCRYCPYDPPHTKNNTNSWDCNPKGDCWCKEMPNTLPLSGSECMSPTELNRMIKEVK